MGRMRSIMLTAVEAVKKLGLSVLFFIGSPASCIWAACRHDHRFDWLADRSSMNKLTGTVTIGLPWTAIGEIAFRSATCYMHKTIYICLSIHANLKQKHISLVKCLTFCNGIVVQLYAASQAKQLKLQLLLLNIRKLVKRELENMPVRQGMSLCKLWTYK